MNPVEVRTLRSDTNRKATITLPPDFCQALKWRTGEKIRIDLDYEHRSLILSKLI